MADELNEYDDIVAVDSGVKHRNDNGGDVGNVYDEVIKSEKEERGYKLRSSFLAAQANNPDEYANIYNLSKKTALPTDVVARNKLEIAAKYEFEKNDYDEIIKSSPKTAAFLSDPENANLAKDDIESLQKIEKALPENYEELVERGKELQASGEIVTDLPWGYKLKRVNDAMYSGFIGNFSKERISNAYASGDAMVKLGSLGFDAMLFGDNEEREIDIAHWQQIMQQTAVEGEGVADSVVLGTINMIPQLKKQGIKSMVGAGVGGVVGFVTPLGTKRGAKWGSTLTSFHEAMQLEAGNAYLEYRDIVDVNGEKIDPAVAKMAAMATGTLNAAIEMVQLDVLAKNVPGLEKFTNVTGGLKAYIKKAIQKPEVRKLLLDSYVSDLTVETATEMAQEAIQIFFREWAKDHSEGYFEEPEQTMGEELSEVFFPTAATMAGMTGLMRGFGGMANRFRNQSKVDQIADSVAESKLYERAPDKAEEFIKQNLENSDMTEAFIPAEDYKELFQSDVELGNKLLEEAGLTEEYNKALETGARFVVPTEKLATMLYKLKNTDYGMMLQRRVTFDMTELTLEEASKSTLSEVIERDIEKSNAYAASKNSEVYDAMMDKLLGAGYTRDNATPVAMLYQTFADNMQLRKADDGSWFQKLGLEINRVEENKPVSLSKKLIDGIFNRNKKEPLTTKDSFLVDLDKLRDSKLMNNKDENGMTLAQFLRYKGGLQDVGGNLKAMDAGKQIVGLINKNGLELDDAAQMAWDAGYFKDKAERPTINDLLDAISDEFTGNVKRYENEFVPTEVDRLAELEAELDRIGVDISMDNDTILQKIAEYQQSEQEKPTIDDVVSGEDLEFFQSGGEVTETPEFKAWFGDSKVVDEDGAPLVVYHGTDAEFDAFDKEKVGNSNFFSNNFYFTDKINNKYYGADTYGKNIMSVYLNIRKPFDVQNTRITKDMINKVNKIIGVFDKKKFSDNYEFLDYLGNATNNDYDYIMQELGYDGIVDFVKGQHIYVAFEPTQIKSIDNQGSFDGSNPNIYYQSDNMLYKVKEESREVVAAEKSRNAEYNEFAKSYFGTTNRLSEAGYILTDGSLLDFSGKKFGGESGTRSIDHREIRDAFEEYSSDVGMEEFINSGNVRFMPESDMFLMSDMPTPQQMKVIESIVNKNDGAVTIELMSDAQNWGSDGDYYKDYDAGTPFSKIKRDINAFYKGGGISDVMTFFQKQNIKIEIVGNELGEYVDNNDLRRKAYKFYKDNLQGGSVIHPELGSIKFIRKGIDKVKSSSADIDKLKLIPKIREIIETATLERSQNNEKPDKNNVIRFHYLSNNVRLDDKNMDVFITIAEDKDGNFFYNINKDIKEPSRVDAKQRRTNEGFEDDNSSYNQSMPQNEDNVNLEIISQENSGVKRGSVRFTDDKTIISLFTKANLSTMLHETGHIFLETMKNFALKDKAPAQIKKDWATIRQFLIVGEDGVLSEKAHERFARAFEAYLMEGKAPSVELQSVFLRFKSWLVNIYRSIRRLNVKLDDEIRGVFDRMLASDKQIEEARALHNYDSWFDTQNQKIMSAAEWKKYQEIKNKARLEATEKLQKELIADIIKERSAEYKAREKEVKVQVAAMVDEMPVYQMMDYITKGKMPNDDKVLGPRKLDKQTLIDSYGADINKLPKNLYKIDGVDPEAVATMFDFATVEEMIAEISSAPTKQEMIEQTTKATLEQEFYKYGSMADITKAANEIIHNEHQLDLMILEDQALRRHYKNNVKLDKNALKLKAEEIIENTKIPQVQRTGMYKAAMDRATNKMFEYAMKGQYELAVRANYQRILNSILLSKAMKATKEIDSIIVYLDSFNKADKRRNIDSDYRDQIDAILERFDLRKSVTQKEIKRRKAFSKWKAEQEAVGYMVEVDTDLMTAFDLRSYKDLTLSQLYSLRDSIKNIDHLAKLKNRLLTDRAAKSYEFTVNDMLSSIGEVAAKKVNEDNEINPTGADKIRSAVEKLNAEHMKAEFITRALDNYKDMGPVWENIFNKMAKAENYELQEMERIKGEMGKIFDKYGKKEKREWTKKQFVEPLGLRLNKLNLFSMALNMGNTHNKEALLKGYKWEENQVNAALNDERYFSHKDWQTVQEVWDMLENTMWDKIKGVCERASGIVPEKVKAEPILTKWGKFKGGYYPIKYDAEMSWRAWERNEKTVQQDGLENQYMKAQTKKGHTKERTAVSGDKVRLQMDVLSSHIKNAVHDYTHREALIDVQKLLADERLKNAIAGKVGIEQFKQFKPWLQGIANDYREMDSYLERIMGRARMGATIVSMGWKVTTAVVQPLGIFTTADTLNNSYGVKVGTKATMDGVAWFFKNPLKWKEKADWVMSKSTFMKNRTKNFDRDVRDFFKVANIGERTKIDESYFYLTAMADMAVCLPSWEAAYNLKFKELGYKNERKAIDYADMVVRISQSAGGAKDLAKIQRGGEFKKMFTLFYSFFSVLYNRFAETKGIYSQTKDMPKLIASAIFLWVAPSLLGELIVGRGPEDDEDELWWTTKELMTYPFQSVVWVRDAVNAVKGDYDYKMSPITDAVTSVAGFAHQLSKGEDFEATKALKKGFEGFSYWYGLPAKQINITVGQFYNWLTGEDDDYSFRDLFYYKPKK